MSETTFAATFRATDQSMAASFSGVQFAGDGGTNVTIGGKILMTLAVDEYVAEHLAQLVNSAPETLNTLAELAAALGDDPNFATTVMELIGKKLDRKTVSYTSVYVEDPTNGTIALVLDTRPNVGTVVRRATGGRVKGGNALDGDDLVPLAQMNEALDARIGGTVKYTERQELTEDEKWTARFNIDALSEAMYLSDRETTINALNFLDARIGDISSALDEVHAYAQALAGGAAV